MTVHHLECGRSLSAGLARPHPMQATRTIAIERGRRWRVELAVAAVALLLFAWAAQGVDWRRLGAILAGVDMGWLAIAAAGTFLSILIRAVRWRLLVAAPLIPVFSATLAGQLANAYLPARAGDVLRSLLLGRAIGRPGGYVLGTTLAERVWDVVVILCLGALVVPRVPAAPGWLDAALAGLAVAASAAICVIWLLPRSTRIVDTVLRRWPRGEAWRPHLIRMLRQFAVGSRRLRTFRRAFLFAFLSVACWALDAAVLATVATALDLRLTPTGALLLVVSLALASAAPSTPGYIGVYQAVAVTVLVPLGFDRGEALAVILVYQAQIYAVVTLFGALGLARLRERRAAAVL